MLGDKIKILRLSNKMSQVELANKLNVSKQSVSNWENNNIMPSIDMLKKIAEQFHCSSDYLLELEDEKFTISTKDLTAEQFAYITAIVREFQKLNNPHTDSKTP